MLEGLSVNERSSPDLHCAVCKDGGGDLVRCECCSTTYHPNCRFMAKRCPTLGCEGRPPRLSQRAPRARHLAPKAVLAPAIVSSVVTAILMALALAAASSCGFEAGYVPGLARASAIVFSVIHVLYAPIRFAITHRGDRSHLEAGTRAALAIVAALGAGLLAAGTMLPPLVVVGLLVVLAAPVIGAFFGAGDPLEPSR